MNSGSLYGKFCADTFTVWPIEFTAVGEYVEKSTNTLSRMMTVHGGWMRKIPGVMPLGAAWLLLAMNWSASRPITR